MKFPTISMQKIWSTSSIRQPLIYGQPTFLNDMLFCNNLIISNTPGYDNLNWDCNKKHFIVIKFKIPTNEKHSPFFLGQTPYKKNLKPHMILVGGLFLKWGHCFLLIVGMYEFCNMIHIIWSIHNIDFTFLSFHNTTLMGCSRKKV